MIHQTKCEECGTPLSEIPFEYCVNHQKHFNELPALTEEELSVYLDHELMKILYERTGDDP